MNFEDDFINEEKQNETGKEPIKNENHFNNLENLNKIRDEVAGKAAPANYSSESLQNNDNNSITLTLDDITVKNMKFIATVMKVFSVLGIISGVFQIFMLFIGVLTIIVSLKFYKAAGFLEEAVFLRDEKKLKAYFSEQAKGLKLYIIFIIVMIVLGIIFYGFIISMVLTGFFNSSGSSGYYNSY